MPDREKVIEGLQDAAAYFRSSFDAMYGTIACETFRNWTDAIEQAIALLKAQEPKYPMPTIDAIPVEWMENMLDETATKNVELNNAIFQVLVAWEREKPKEG